MYPFIVTAFYNVLIVLKSKECCFPRHFITGKVLFFFFNNTYKFEIPKSFAEQNFWLLECF